MNDLLLVLILLTDPTGRPAAEAVAQRVTDQGAVKVVIGPDALAQLKAYGLNDADLTAQPALGMTLTGKERKLAIVRIDRQVRGGNAIIESVVWAGGHREQHVAISGARRPVPLKPNEPVPAVPQTEPADPLDSVARGVGGILAPWEAASGASPAAEIENQLAGLSDQKDWAKIISLTADAKAPTPRMRYYRILALHVTQQQAEAEAAFAEFRQAAPKHILIDALEQELHPVIKPTGSGLDINNAPSNDDGSNVLH
jgi:hypothetical protein